jgi:hypothetical protein
VPPKREGGHFGLRATSAWIVRQGPPVDFTLDSPALRVGAGKSGVGGGEWKVSSPQFSVLFLAKNCKICPGLTLLRSEGDARPEPRELTRRPG